MTPLACEVQVTGGAMQSIVSAKLEASLVAALTALVAAALIAVERTPHGYDKFVWLVGALLLVAGGITWRLQRWPARPWVVFVASGAFAVVGYAMWLWWYTATHPPQAV